MGLKSIKLINSEEKLLKIVTNCLAKQSETIDGWLKTLLQDQMTMSKKIKLSDEEIEQIFQGNEPTAVDPATNLEAVRKIMQRTRQESSAKTLGHFSVVSMAGVLSELFKLFYTFIEQKKVDKSDRHSS